MIPFKHVFKELFSERTRILLTILAVAWGTASITIMLALGEGLRLTFGRAMNGMGNGILVVNRGQTSRAYGGLPEGHKVRLTEDDLRAVRAAIPEIAEISGEYARGKPMRTASKWRSGRVVGVEPAFGSIRNVAPAPGGRFINQRDIEGRRRVVMLGTQAVKELYEKGQDPIGTYVEIDGRPFLVVGVMQKKFQSSCYGGPDYGHVWIPGTTYKTMFGARDYRNWVVKPHRPEQMETVKTRIREILAANHGCDPTDEGIVRYWDALEMQEISNAVFYGFQTFLGIIGALTLIVAGVGIANVMYVSVSGATRDIGIRMAVGAKGYQVLTQYVLEALAATAVGGLVGLAVSQGVVSLVGLIPMSGEFFEFVGKPVPVLSGAVAAVVIGVLGLIGFLAGLFPARRAAQVDPAEALRYE